MQLGLMAIRDVIEEVSHRGQCQIKAIIIMSSQTFHEKLDLFDGKFDI